MRIRTSIGSQIAHLRLDAAVTRAELAAAGGIDPSYLWKIEQGVASASLDVLVAIAACLGADLGVRLFPGSGPRLVDRFQAPMIEALTRRLDDVWVASPEVPVPRARGIIDLVIARRDSSLAIVCECHSEIRALDATIRRVAEKAQALRELGRYGDVSSLLFLRSTTRTRDLAHLYESTLTAAFPAKAGVALAALMNAATPWPGPALLWVRLDGGRASVLDGPPRGVRLGR